MLGTTEGGRSARRNSSSRTVHSFDSFNGSQAETHSGSKETKPIGQPIHVGSQT